MLSCILIGRDACQGDSGGPLFTKRHKNNTRYDLLRYEIVGITSFGRDCGLSGFPGRLTACSNLS